MTVKKQGDDYVHFGLLNSVRRILCESKPIISDQKINLIVSVGGILLYKSIIANSGQHFVAFISYHLSMLGYVTLIRIHPYNVEEFVLEFFTKCRKLLNDDLEFKGVRLTGHILDLYWVRLSKAALLCENYAKLYFDTKHLEKELNTKGEGICLQWSSYAFIKVC